MPDDLQDESLSDLFDERSRLLAMAFRILGSRADAEDAVQDTYARWYRMTDEERAAVRVPAAWLTTALGRVSLNMLGSARHRREQYVGQWLPEPTAARGAGPGTVAGAPGPVDPADRVTLDDEVSMALMVVLESLTPAERVVFVLHDVFRLPFDEIAGIVGRTTQACRTLASSARRHIADRRSGDADPEQQRRVVGSFWAAARSGDLAALVGLLDPHATATSDGGGHVRAALRVVAGADRVARFLLGALGKSDDLVAELENDGAEPQLVIRRGDMVVGVGSFHVVGERVADIWLVLNPEKLRTWNPES
ncbi:RNA polymerase sigma factor SigJ [Nakamurella alba]|nr:RNA polymerase sigma factor SigJ [Nakamurella alba]